MGFVLGHGSWVMGHDRQEPDTRQWPLFRLLVASSRNIANLTRLDLRMYCFMASSHRPAI